MWAVFKYPDDPSTIKLAGSLWVDTSYALIDRYRKLVSEMEAKIAQNRGSGRRVRYQEGQEGPVALRKLLKRFASFLGDEEKFWTRLFVRFAKTYHVAEATPAIGALSLMAADPDDLLRNTHSIDSMNIDVPEQLESTPDNSPRRPSSTATENMILFLQKCLISLGDLARYQVMNSGGKSSSNREGRGNDRISTMSFQDFSTAADFYHHARLLFPSEGNPHNQLAILFMYADNHFDATLYYYRALCVERPFPTSRGNLVRFLKKSLNVSKSATFPKHSTDHLKWLILELHAYWHHKPT